MLNEYLDQGKPVGGCLLSREDYRPYPTIDDRSAWQALPSAAAESVLVKAEALRPITWPSLPATLYMDYARTGNRSRFEAEYFRKRSALCLLVLAECLRDEGTYLDDIVNGVWSLCEETSWTLPAHNNMHPQPDLLLGGNKRALPDSRYPVIDLFAAETGALLAWTHHLLGARLNTVSPLIAARLLQEVECRILQPYLANDGFWWMGLGERVGHLNNWNPWINSNCLAAFLLLERDVERRELGVGKIMRSLSVFLDRYPADGGCDEGPGYWDRAGGSVHDALEQLYSASEGRIDVYTRPLIREMGRYLYRVHIHGRSFVNFADCSPLLSIHPARAYRFGKRIGDDRLAGLGLDAFRSPNGVKPGQSHDLQHALMYLFTYRELADDAGAYEPVRDVWLPDTEVMVARETDSTGVGWFVAAKGGHNAESHNHNDVGNVIVFADGEPVLIDAGVDTYTAKTFSAERYTIWTMQSAYHNLPTVNGEQQKPGAGFRSQSASYAASGRESALSLDIAGAYPPEAGITEWRRTVRLVRGEGGYIEIADRAQLDRESTVAFHWLTRLKPEAVKGGGFRVTLGSGRQVRFFPAAGAGELLLERIPLEAGRLHTSWGGELFRVTCSARTPASGRADWSWRLEGEKEGGGNEKKNVQNGKFPL